MATETRCQTPGAQFHVHIDHSHISIRIDTPHSFDLTEKQAALLDANIHNALELALASVWPREVA